MANKPKLGQEAKLIQPRHGRSGDVPLNVGVPQELKTSIVFKAEKLGLTIRELVIQTLEKGLSEV